MNLINKVTSTIQGETTPNMNDFNDLKKMFLSMTFNDLSQINYIIEKFEFWYKTNQLLNNHEAQIYLDLMTKFVDNSNKEIITTPDELQTFNVIKNDFKNKGIDTDKLTYIDYPEHFDILYDDKILCRAQYNKTLSYSDKQINVNDWFDIHKITNDLYKIIKC